MQRNVKKELIFFLQTFPVIKHNTEVLSCQSPGSREHRTVAAALVLRRQAPRRPAAGGRSQDHARVRGAGHSQHRPAAAELVARAPPRPLTHTRVFVVLCIYF